MAPRSFSPPWHASHQLCITLLRNKYLPQNTDHGKFCEQHKGTYRQSAGKPKPSKHQQISPCWCSGRWHGPQDISLRIYFKGPIEGKNSTKNTSEFLPNTTLEGKSKDLDVPRCRCCHSDFVLAQVMGGALKPDGRQPPRHHSC